MSYRLLERLGVELEYMLVRDDSLEVAPIADQVLFDAGAGADGDLPRGMFSWSNELTNHVVELKTLRPVEHLEHVHLALHAEVSWFREQAARHGCTLLPTAMHPWMNPSTETVLWPHDNTGVYQAYDRIFHCQGHGWANVQSTHLNLSFSGDAEFAKLHAAIRILLPLIPGIAASSPMVEGKWSGHHDSRLFFYRDNQSRVPEIAGSVIPEPLYCEADYRRGIFEPIATAMQTHDPDGILELDFLNSRGAIARFDRGSIEIRLVDIQECPAADLAILEVIVESLRWIVKTIDFETIRSARTDDLAKLLWQTAHLGGDAVVEIAEILDLWQFNEPVAASVIWQSLFDEVGAHLSKSALRTFASILVTGTLSDRIRNAVGQNSDHGQIAKIYRNLANCLAMNRLFKA
ncbi:MAG: glutamate-cysteine ligase family protein [Verrucomicrobia bacterium]|nr:glutamate-cysteine ligase family protein [Verrucomicrobiota bacterium]